MLSSRDSRCREPGSARSWSRRRPRSTARRRRCCSRASSAPSRRRWRLKVTRIASGVPHGGDLEFADQVTLGRAIEHRRSFGSTSKDR